VRSVALALVAATLAAAVATESATSGTVPVATYVQRADAVCLDVAKKAVSLQKQAQVLVAAADTEADVRTVFARVYRRQLALVRNMRLRFAAIGAPRGARAARVAARLVADTRKGERALAEVIAATEHGSTAAIAQAVSRYRTISLTSAQAMRRSGLGFRYCGAGA
jgi:hypothetical protein